MYSKTQYTSWWSVLKPILCIVWVIWAFSLKPSMPHVKLLPPQSHSQRIDLVRRDNELGLFKERLLRQSDRDRFSYTAERFFADLRLIVAKDAELGHPRLDALHDPTSSSDFAIAGMRERALLVSSGVNSPDGKTDAFSYEQARFTAWKNLNYPEPPSPMERWCSHLQHMGRYKVAMGFLSFYLKTMLVFFLFILIRIKELGGMIVAVFKRQPWRMLRIILFWPIGFFIILEEPLREVYVKTELRRQRRGWRGLFSRLTAKEERQAQEIAADNARYARWRRSLGRKTFYHSFAAALVMTLFWSCFASAAPIRKPVRGPFQHYVTQVHIHSSALVVDRAPPSVTVEVWIPSRILPRPPLLVGVEVHYSHPPEPIPLFFVIFVIKQLLQGDKLCEKLRWRPCVSLARMY